MTTSELDVPSRLATSLRRCVAVCEETLDEFVAGEPTSARTQFASSLMLAVAALETVIADRSREREAALIIASTLCRQAVASTRAYGLDERLLRCADALDRASTLCEQALRPPSL